MSGDGHGRREGQICPLCGGPARPLFTARDLNQAVTRESFEYWRCQGCGTCFLDPVPADLGRYYPRDSYNVSSREAREAAAPGERFKLGLIAAETARGGRLVEIGPGYGVFASGARDAGFDVTVIEMDESSVERLAAIGGLRTIQSPVPEQVLPTLEPSSVIVMWHVIEHLPRPWAVLESAAANLAPGGLLAIAAPNPDSLQFRLLRSRWAHVDAPRHLFLIPPATLARRCEELGLRLALSTTVDPVGLDLNLLGWFYALRAAPRSGPPRRWQLPAARRLAALAAPVEARGQRGCAYTLLFAKDPAL